jgi:hypothetical protein
MDLKERGEWGVDWIHVAQDRDQLWAVVNTVMHLRVAGKFLEQLLKKGSVPRTRLFLNFSFLKCTIYEGN